MLSFPLVERRVPVPSKKTWRDDFRVIFWSEPEDFVTGVWKWIIPNDQSFPDDAPSASRVTDLAASWLAKLDAVISEVPAESEYQNPSTNPPFGVAVDETTLIKVGRVFRVTLSVV